MKRTGIVALSGYNPRAIITFCRFAKKSNLDVHLFAKNRQDSIFKTEYSSWVYVTRSDVTLTLSWLIKQLSQVRIDYQYDNILILPSTEFLNRFILRYRDELEANNIIIPLAAREVYKQVSDKQSFGQLCESRGLKVPQVLPKSHNQFPFVAKPIKYSLTQPLKPHLIFNKSEYDHFLENEDHEKYYFQDFITGNSLYLLYYVSNRNMDVLFSQENLIQQADGGSIICATSSDIHHLPIANDYLNLFKAIDFYGLVMVEIREYKNEYYMIEANPRFWGPMQLALDSGLPFFEHFIKECGITTPPSHENHRANRQISYLWSGGIAADQALDRSVVFHNYSPREFIDHYAILMQSDIYLRDDTLQLFKSELNREKIAVVDKSIEKLIELYNKTSKHSNYQVLASKLKNIIHTDALTVDTRYEVERLNYIKKHLPIKNKNITDIGGNTGFFTFELQSLGASKVNYYEGNREHASFVRQAAIVLGCADQIAVSNSYVELEKREIGKNIEILLLLNVLHHIGDDYGDSDITKANALKIICNSLCELAKDVDTLVFQLGFNWKGNPKLPLFNNGTKKELIDFIKQCTSGRWEIQHIGIPVRHGDGITYTDLNENNIQRDDSLGEFLNRPLFIMKSIRS